MILSYSMDTGTWSRLTDLDVYHTANLYGSKRDENRTLILGADNQIKSYPSEDKYDGGAAAIWTKKYSIKDDNGNNLYFKVRKVKIRFTGTPTMLGLRVYNEKFESPGFVTAALTEMESDRWYGIMSGLKGHWMQFRIFGVHELIDIEVDVAIIR